MLMIRFNIAYHYRLQ